MRGKPRRERRGGCHLSGLPPTRLAVFLAVVAAFAVFGSLFADVDVHSSKMRQFLGGIGTLAAVAIAGTAVVVRPGLVVDPLQAALPGPTDPVVVAGGVIVLAAVGAKLVGNVFDDLTTHRGFFHSPVVPLVLAGAGAALLYVLGFQRPTVLATGGGVVGIAGLSHIITDAVA
jgi:hypothetical protein